MYASGIEVEWFDFLPNLAWRRLFVWYDGTVRELE